VDFRSLARGALIASRTLSDRAKTIRSVMSFGLPPENSVVIATVVLDTLTVPGFP
jgi:hypothetical protein